MMNPTEIKKETIKNKIIANFSHYVQGSLYYRIVLADGTYQFPIHVTEKINIGSLDKNGNPYDELSFSNDIGTTSFEAQMKASLLNRWIEKAIKNEEFIKIV